MEIRRTANAGILLRLDHISILMDGVCREVPPYLATPPQEWKRLIGEQPDVIVFTHAHPDHFDSDASLFVDTPVVGTKEVGEEMPDFSVCSVPLTVGGVTVTPVPTRHMGKSVPGGHFSFVVRGSKTVWFMGDASPIELKALESFPKPDVLVAPFPYASSPGAVRKVNELSPKALVLIHMPDQACDPAGLWNAVLAHRPLLDVPLYLPEIGAELQF